VTLLAIGLSQSPRIYGKCLQPGRSVRSAYKCGQVAALAAAAGPDDHATGRPGLGDAARSAYRFMLAFVVTGTLRPGAAGQCSRSEQPYVARTE